MIRDCLGMFKGPAIFEIECDSCAAKRVWRNILQDAGAQRPALDHPPGVHTVHPIFTKRPPLAAGRAKQRLSFLAGEACRFDIGVQIFQGLMVQGDLVMLAAFFLQTDEVLFAARVEITHLECYLIFSKTAEAFRPEEIERFQDLAGKQVPCILFTNKELEPYRPYDRYSRGEIALSNLLVASKIQRLDIS
jgi:hypothetical protein